MNQELRRWRKLEDKKCWRARARCIRKKSRGGSSKLRPSLALQKKVGLKSLEQVIRWGDRVNQELRRWRKLEDKKCWRARARCIRKKSRGGSSGLSKAQALVELERQERGYQKEVAKVRGWWLQALEEVERIVQPEEKLILWSEEDQEQRRMLERPWRWC